MSDSNRRGYLCLGTQHLLQAKLHISGSGTRCRFSLEAMPQQSNHIGPAGRHVAGIAWHASAPILVSLWRDGPKYLGRNPSVIEWFWTKRRSGFMIRRPAGRLTSDPPTPRESISARCDSANLASRERGIRSVYSELAGSDLVTADTSHGHLPSLPVVA